MSLEQAVLANTAAIEKLISVFQGAATTMAAPQAAEADKPAGKPKKSSVPAVKAEEPKAPELTYADIKAPFLDLVNDDKAKAIALLQSFNAKTLQDVKKEQWPKVLEKIEEARG